MISGRVRLAPALVPCHAGPALDGAILRCTGWDTMLALLGLLLIVWLVLVILGFVVEGLFWLAIIGIVLFLVTGRYGAAKRSTLRK